MKIAVTAPKLLRLLRLYDFIEANGALLVRRSRAPLLVRGFIHGSKKRRLDFFGDHIHSLFFFYWVVF